MNANGKEYVHVAPKNSNNVKEKLKVEKQMNFVMPLLVEWPSITLDTVTLNARDL